MTERSVERMHLLKSLSEAFGPSGCEDPAAALLRETVSPYADEVSADRLGSVIALYRRRAPEQSWDPDAEPASGDAPDCGRLMLAAHMDEPGFMIASADGDGYLHVSALSGRDPMTLNAEDVWVGNEEGQVPGYFGVKPAHLGGSGDYGSLYVDIGAKDKEDAEKHVKKADFGAYRSALTPLGAHRLMGKALGGRGGCAVLCDVLRRLKEEDAVLPFDVYFVFTTRELIGGSSAAAANKIGPDLSLLFDGAAADDTRGEEYGFGTRLGEGAALSHMDRSAIYDRELCRFLADTAAARGIPAQTCRYPLPGRDSGPVNRSGIGVKAAVLSLPVRNLGTGNEVADFRDFEALCELAREAVLALGRG